MPPERHYTVEQANAAIPSVQERIDALRAALHEATPGNGGGEPGRVVSEAFLAMRRSLHELQEMGVILRDLDRGLADFPSRRDGREIYLCWVEGEDEVRHWHGPEDGFDGRQPLSDDDHA